MYVLYLSFDVCCFTHNDTSVTNMCTVSSEMDIFCSFAVNSVFTNDVALVVKCDVYPQFVQQIVMGRKFLGAKCSV